MQKCKSTQQRTRSDGTHQVLKPVKRTDERAKRGATRQHRPEEKEVPLA